MSGHTRCLCSHIRALHRDGVCQARINVCGCIQYQPDDDTADQPGCGPLVSEKYSGFYAGRNYKLND